MDKHYLTPRIVANQLAVLAAREGVMPPGTSPFEAVGFNFGSAVERHELEKAERGMTWAMAAYRAGDLTGMYSGADHARLALIRLRKRWKDEMQRSPLWKEAWAAEETAREERWERARQEAEAKRMEAQQ